MPLQRYVIILALALTSNALTAQVVSDFSASADGWTAPNAAPNLVPSFTYEPTGGNPGGHVSARPYSVALGAVTVYLYYYFIAPTKFLGNRSAYYNGTLRFDLQQSSSGTPIQHAEVLLRSGGNILYYFPATPFLPAAAPAWTTYSVRLGSGSGAWKTEDSPTGPAATEAQIRTVLSNLTGLEIRGLFRDATTTNRLDNVTLRPPITITTQPASTTVCDGATATLAVAATGNPNLGYRWQRETSPGVWTNVTNSGGYSGATTNTLTVNTAGNFGAGRYRCQISGTQVELEYTSVATIAVNLLPTAPTTTGNASCASGSLTLSASGGSAGQYRWYTVASGGSPISGVTGSTYTTPVLTTSTTYYVAINNGTCQSTRTSVTATINTPPTAPVATGTSSCGSSALTLSASGGSAGQYRWYTVASGGSPISGVTGSTYTTPVLTTSTTYYVAINNGTCQSTRTSVTATINTPPTAPATTGGESCEPAALTLSATGAAAGQYRWYTTASGGTPVSGEVNGTYTTPVLTSTTLYYAAIHNGTCESARAVVSATIAPPVCDNTPPIIESTPVATHIEGFITLNLTDLISDSDDNLDLSTLTILVHPSSGATAFIDANHNLVIDYGGIAFSGMENITLQVCDIFDACVQQAFSIEVAGAIEVFNAISPNSDDRNEAFFIEHIEKLADTRQNRVTIMNRWGDVVWEGTDYDNESIVFTGKSNTDSDLPSGTYFYKIEFLSGRQMEVGYLTLKR